VEPVKRHDGVEDGVCELLQGAARLAVPLIRPRGEPRFLGSSDLSSMETGQQV